jgi:hypothetical protein
VECRAGDGNNNGQMLLNFKGRTKVLAKQKGSTSAIYIYLNHDYDSNLTPRSGQAEKKGLPLTPRNDALIYHLLLLWAR